MEWIFIICKTRSRKLQQQLASILKILLPSLIFTRQVVVAETCSRKLLQKVVSEYCRKLLAAKTCCENLLQEKFCDSFSWVSKVETKFSIPSKACYNFTLFL